MAEFETARPRLMSIAYRMLGSVQDAEDAVQSAWLRAVAADTGRVNSPVAWLTTITIRICLDQLRARQRRGEIPLLASDLPDERIDADEQYLRREEVSRALLVLMNQLAPAQRAAFVLHDLFEVPFDEIAEMLGVTIANARQLASRARARVRMAGRRPETVGHAPDHSHSSIVEAFLQAAAGGDLTGMIDLMAPDCVRVATAGLLPPGAPERVHGAARIAEETRLFAARIAAIVQLFSCGEALHVIAPGGHPLARLTIEVDDGLVTRILIEELGRHDLLVAC